MEDFTLSHDYNESEHNVTTMPVMSFADLKEEAELEQVDFETLLEEIRVS